MPTQTTVTVDVALMLGAVMPTVAILVTAWISSRRQRAIAKVSDAKTDQVHKLVNDQLTQEKVLRLDLMRSQRLLLRETLKAGISDSEAAILAGMDERIEALADEIERRDTTAATLQ